MKIERNKSYKGDCIELMKYLPDGSVDVISTDPPYLYLKNQKLDRPFDEWEFFNQAKRVLKKDGFKPFVIEYDDMLEDMALLLHQRRELTLREIINKLSSKYPQMTIFEYEHAYCEIMGITPTTR